MQVGGGAVDIVGLYTLAVIVDLCGFLLGLRDRDAVPHDPGRPADADARLPVLFLAPVYVPLALLGDVLHTFARYNPVTYALESGPVPGRRPDARRARVWPAASGSGLSLRVGTPRAPLGRAAG